jgi:hypothetical protein
MSIFFETFNEKIKNLWNKVHLLNKPIHPYLTWTFGLIKSRADFEDLQIQ